jgi:hypothetical protein
MEQVEQAVEKTTIGRPKKIVDEKLIYKLAMIHCTNPEIASILGIGVDTLQRNYGDVIRSGRESGKQKLRRTMWQSALAGNVTMMIWLSKNILGYTDNILVSEEKKPLPWSDDENKIVEPTATPDAVEEVELGEVREDLDELKSDLDRL